ncbi:MAG: TIM barrel protein [Lachnospiraceae bacterium]|nr:TIM barrel protein [Lachnospiraceae bacterium]
MNQLHIIPNRNDVEKWARIAKELNAVFEYNDFFDPELIENKEEYEATIEKYLTLDRDRSKDTFHGVFYDIVLNSPDPVIREASIKRVYLSCETAVRLECRAVIFHTNYIVGFKNITYRDKWVRDMTAFYKQLLDDFPSLDIYVENMYDDTPELIRRLAENLRDEPRFGICFDIAHAYLWELSVKEWIDELAPYIRHIHANDNHKDQDSHMAIGTGSIDWSILNYRQLIKNKPSLLIEVSDEERLMKSYNYLIKNCLYPFHMRNRINMEVTDDMERILEIGRELTIQKDYAKLLENIIGEAMEIANCDAGTLYIFNEGKLHFMIMRNNTMNVYQGGNGEPINMPPVKLEEQYVCAYCALHNETINVDDVYTNERFNWKGPREYDRMTGYRTRSMLVIPLENHDGKVIGVLQLINALDINGDVCNFSENNEFITSSLASQAAISLSNMLMIRELRDLLNSFVEAMVTAIDSRTPYNANHTMHVAEYCDKFCKYLQNLFLENKTTYNISNDEREELVMAAKLHDVGKMITPLNVMNKADRLAERLPIMEMRFKLIEQILKTEAAGKEIDKETFEKQVAELNDNVEFIRKVNTAGFLPDDMLERVNSLEGISYGKGEDKLSLVTEDELSMLRIRKGTLSPEERHIIEQHVEYTDKILSEIAFGDKYKRVKFIAAAHHEYLDGSGYPNHLTAEDIPVEVRILTIMDVFDSLSSSDRPYRKESLSNEKIFSILEAMVREGKLDGELVALAKDCFCAPAENAVETK